MFDRIERLAVIAPHPDDEVLGCGGTIARCASEGAEVHVIFATTGVPHLASNEEHELLRAEARAAHVGLGVARTHFLDLPAARLDTLPQAEVNRAVAAILQAVVPDTVLMPFVGDIHFDHQVLFSSTLVATRPTQVNYPKRLWAYETLSETNWNAPYVTPSFEPMLFVDIASSLDRKLAAMKAYRSQIRIFPHERSVEAIEALARLRGATVHRQAAEAFVLLRSVI
jgi:LmbE family N-acetylglucosaminyl deacetylase